MEFLPLSDAVPGCELCAHAGGELVFVSSAWRVIRVPDSDFPAFYRVVWNDHVAEFSELSAGDRVRCMEVVCCVEQVLRAQLSPTKINLAAFGNMVPHLHWHVIARFDWDSHFPQPVWGVRQREVRPVAVSRLQMPPTLVDVALRDALQSL